MSIVKSSAILNSDGYVVSNSLRFRASASAYLSRTFGTPTNNKIWTFSKWTKRGTLGSQNIILSAYDGASSVQGQIQFNADDTISLLFGGASATALTTTAKFRDPAAHYHVVVSVNATTTTSNIWINNQLVATSTSYPSSVASQINGALSHKLGTQYNAATGFFDGYMSEINFIDGQALDPSAFGQIDPDSGIWIPKKYTGTYGTNGFYLPFNDGSSLANLTADKSGNGNNWTANNISLTTGTTYDLMKDSPTNGVNDVGNYATLNPILEKTGNSTTAITLSNGNLKATVTTSSGSSYAKSTIALPKSGLYYWETTITKAADASIHGVNEWGVGINFAVGTYLEDGYYRKLDGSYIAFGSSFTTGDIIGVAFDCNNGKLFFAKNGVWQNSGDPIAGTGYAESVIAVGCFPTISQNTSSGLTAIFDINFGQRPFAYTPPTGFKSLCSSNLPTPTIKKGSDHFNIKLDTGANIKTSSEALYTSFLEWIKDRANSNNHQLMDTVRGTSNVLQSNTTSTETTYTAPSGSSISWVWKAGGAPVPNTDGTIASQVSANVAAGFSIVSHSGNGINNATVGHSLGVAPSMVITKGKTSGDEWPVYHKSLAAANNLYLHLTNAQNAISSVSQGGIAGVSSTTFTCGIGSVNLNNTNALGHNYISYCFAEVEGFSKFGSYVGNGNADGAFVNCGFRPRYVLIKNASSAEVWFALDAIRDTYNPESNYLLPNTNNAEAATNLLDFASNGFKIRTTGPSTNTNGNTYIFAAFAENPFALNPRAR